MLYHLKTGEVSKLIIMKDWNLNFSECGAGMYGADCTSTCGHCAGGQTTCDNRTGDCPSPAGCAAGYNGTKCDEGVNYLNDNEINLLKVIQG